ncbi:unnamed protein product [Rotaria sordida]|uniref:Uncharacterized protein n=1 Tax=Rotaria sordida TaxID=392033 RepID=A0A815HUI8_9BILA|nr:unnamed protein product [Rotaria sordida]CAF1604878.1 unnamed protein product [Rotaria sordida]
MARPTTTTATTVIGSDDSDDKVFLFVDWANTFQEAAKQHDPKRFPNPSIPAVSIMIGNALEFSSNNLIKKSRHCSSIRAAL